MRINKCNKVLYDASIIGLIMMILDFSCYPLCIATPSDSPFIITMKTTNTTVSPPTGGSIEDALCRIEDLEQANDSQLYTILQDLRRTSFFRTFVVNLNRKCPLRSWRTNKTSIYENTHQIVDLEKSDDLFDEDSENECLGGVDDLDDDSEPLCSITIDASETFPFGKKIPENIISSLESNALHSLLKDGYDSVSQRNAFSWKFSTDQVVTSDDGKESSSCMELGDSTPRLLPDTFWNDMCRNLQDETAPDDYMVTEGDKRNVINLLLNPERNTAYNGTHIWRAIYEENCITVDGDDKHMCLEERVLYKLLSGLHTSTTISISMNYFPPSKRKNRSDWEPNPTYFMSKFENNPDYIRNLHFSYVVLLRALHKASPFLYDYISNRKNVHTGNTVEDETAIVLLRRLLDSSILNSCSSVFTAFDESLMFKESPTVSSVSSKVKESKSNNFDPVSLQKNFKGVFHNVSSILNCVQCQQCKLHGKLTMLGYGTALKVLFMEKPSLERNEIVAFVNTIAKFSESIRDIRHLTQLYWTQQHQQEFAQVESRRSLINERHVSSHAAVASEVDSSEELQADEFTNTVGFDAIISDSGIFSLEVVDATIGVVAYLGRKHIISIDREVELVHLAIQRHPDLLLLGKHYSTDAAKFLKVSSSIGFSASETKRLPHSEFLDAVVVGSGLAGLTATLNILDRGGRVVLLEKEHLLGGNSNKASSGINACCPSNTSSQTDSVNLFEDDTLKSAGESARPELVSVLVSKSAQAVEWLTTRVGVDLSLTSQLGGHSDKRTHRPSDGMVGAEIIYGLQKAIKEYEKSGQVRIIVNAKVTKLLTHGGNVTGVEYLATEGDIIKTFSINTPNVILATGGFASDRSPGSYLEKYRPELLRMPTTAGSFSTGDGISLALELSARVVDMDKVQIHPTGWVDPSDPNSTSKTLAAELLRGVGGILLNKWGQRFCNELGTRSYVTEKMLSHDGKFSQSGKWDIESPVPTFALVLSSTAASGGTKKHVDLYRRKGLMVRLDGVAALGEWMGLPKLNITNSLRNYQSDAKRGHDEFGKTVFPNVFMNDLEKEVFYAGIVTPVLHYCMGGIMIDTEGSVLNAESGNRIQGLHAVGEVTGGVHGANRLGGNSLLECTVFGTVVGQKIPIYKAIEKKEGNNSSKLQGMISEQEISRAELQKHNTPEDCWVAIHGVVYDLTHFAYEHPAGAESIHDLAGTDGTAAFDAVHSPGILNDFEEEKRGVLGI